MSCCTFSAGRLQVGKEQDHVSAIRNILIEFRQHLPLLVDSLVLHPPALLIYISN